MSIGMEDRVAIVTGAGRGLGREHAVLLGRLGARVVVNDFGGAGDGSGGSVSVAQEVADEINSQGGSAVANSASVADFDAARGLVQQAIDTFGSLDVVVNNAGILRDRMLVNMTESDWDAVMAVHLKGHFAVMQAAFEYWRGAAKDGAPRRASVINTSSVSGFAANVGQANYAAAKAGIAAMSLVAAQEGARYGIRVNAIAPVARTRMTMASPGTEGMSEVDNDGGFDALDPGNVSPLVAYLASENCPVTGGVFHTAGNQVGLFHGWQLGGLLESEGRWRVEDLAEQVPSLLEGREFASLVMDMPTFNKVLAPLGSGSHIG